jgi:hypothetical protein
VRLFGIVPTRPVVVAAATEGAVDEPSVANPVVLLALLLALALPLLMLCCLGLSCLPVGRGRCTPPCPSSSSSSPYLLSSGCSPFALTDGPWSGPYLPTRRCRSLSAHSARCPCERARSRGPCPCWTGTCSAPIAWAPWMSRLSSVPLARRQSANRIDDRDGAAAMARTGGSARSMSGIGW